MRARQLLFFGRTLGLTRSSGTAQEVETRLARARVVILGDGLFGACAFDVLQRSGCEDLRVLDWAAMARAHPSWFGRDGVHPTMTGYRARAAATARLVRAC